MSSIERGPGAPVLLVAESYDSADMFYATGFLAPDRFVFIGDGDAGHVFVSQMEYGRAKKESGVASVHSMEEYGYTGRLLRLRDPDLAMAEMIADILGWLRIRSVRVPADFPLLLGDLLRSKGVEAVPTPRLFEDRRSVKTGGELEKIARAQAVNETAMAHAIGIISESEPVSGVLHYGGRPLTSEFLRSEIEVIFIKNGCDAEDSIVASGPPSADPHYAGEGPVREGEPIVIDLFPYGKKDRYFADMTRTVVRGRPPAAVERMYDAVLGAQEAAFGAIRAGVTGKEVNDRVCDYFEAHGYGTTRTKSEEGFIHSTGHGVGLDIHELPSLGEAGIEPLRPGQVVTVEPGLYARGVGGVRIEDMVVVTKTGYTNLTHMPKRLVV